MAAQASNEDSYANPLYDINTNTVGTLELLKWSLQNDIKKFIYASSVGVYGEPETNPVDETSKTKPKSFYGITKLASEHYVRIFNELGLNTTTLILFSIYGHHQNMENINQGMTSIYMHYIGQNLPITVKGSLDRFRDFVYMDDVVSAINLSVSNKKSNGKIFNVCSNRKTPIRELIKIIVNKFGYDEYLIEVEEPTIFDQFGVYGKYDLINKTIGWKPKVKLEDGIERMVEWVKKYYG